MKRYFLFLVFLTLAVCQVNAQDTLPVKKPTIHTVQDALVSYANEDVAVLSYNGRNYEVGNKGPNFEKGRRYFALIRIWDCGDCPIIKGVIEYSNISVEQTKIDINLKTYYMKQKLKRFDKD